MGNNKIIHYKIFGPYKNILAFSTSKQFMENQAPRFTGDSAEVFQNNRFLLAEILGINSSQLVFPRQTHTKCVAKITEIPDKEISETDALVTNRSGICLCVQTADCVPILLFDPVTNAIAAIHAGWRGTVQKIAEVAIQKMSLNYNSSLKNIRALIGPSIGPDIYEVGNEVVELVRKNIPFSEKTLHKKYNGKYRLNLWEANLQILLNCGLNKENVEIAEECSFTKKDTYFSARRDGINTGRTVSGIMIRDDK